MSREIKFRAWDKQQSKYHDVLGISRFSEGVDGRWEVEVSGDWLSPKDVILEQYTGLKDKNGKEIYEGDKLLWEYQSVLSLPHKKHVRTFIVVWDGKKSRWSQYEYGDCEGVYSIWKEWEKTEVIGNVHESEKK